MNNLPTFNPTSFNPLNIVGQGNQKVQHPTSGYSNTISHNVDGMHKEFTGFHKHLKNLMMLYKTRHQLMESLNENGLYTAKCFHEMLHGSPLTAIVAPDGMRMRRSENNVVTEERAPSPHISTMVEKAAQYEDIIESGAHNVVASNISRSTPSKTFEERLEVIPYEHQEDIETTEYPESGVMREMLDPDEGSRVGTSLPKQNPAPETTEYPKDEAIQEIWNQMLDPDEGSMKDALLSKNILAHEPEGLKASKKMSMPAAYLADTAAKAMDMVEEKHAVEEKFTQNDPPSASSIVSGGDNFSLAKYNKRESTDAPDENPFPDDEDISVERNPRWEKDHTTSNVTAEDMGGSFNMIVDDDDDSFADHQKVVPERKSAIDEGSMDLNTRAYENIDDTPKKSNAIVVAGEEINTEEEFAREIGERTEQENDPFPATAIADPEIGHLNTDHDTSSCDGATDDEGKEKEYLNISNDGELLVMKSTPERRSQQAAPPSKPKNDDSYFDVHKAAFNETNSKLDEHENLVQYVEMWENTVLTRVQSRYFEYVKHRNSLNHYAKKVDSLLDEEEKLRLKNRPMKPKQKEKLDRNQVKLTGSRETHDGAGESLLMLMDEVIIRSWRDAFPLLKRSIFFENDFAAIQHEHMTKLSGSMEALDIIGEKEHISMDGRMELFRDMNPEDMYTGSRDTIFSRENR